MRAALLGYFLWSVPIWAAWFGPKSVRAQTVSVEQEWRLLTTAQAAYQRGNQWAERGDRTNADREWEVAMGGFQEVLRLNPMRTDLYAPMADIHLRKGRAAVAYALLSQQVRNGVKELAVRVQIVRALRAMNRRGKAMSACEELRKEMPTDETVAALYAELLAEDGQSDQALALLGPVLPKLPFEARHPGLDAATMRRLYARLLVAKKRGEDAEKCLAELIREKPNDPEAQLLLGQAQIVAGKHAAAVTALRTYVGQFPRDGRARAALGLALAESGQLLLGIETLEQTKDVPEALLQLSQLYLRKLPPDTTAALGALSKARQLLPGDLPICVEVAALRNQIGQTAQALADIEGCSDRLLGADGGLGPVDGTAQRAVLLRLDLQIKNGKFDAAMQTWNGVRARYPGLQSLKGKLAQALVQRGLSKLPTNGEIGTAGLSDLQEAHKLAPQWATAQALALGQIGAGRPQDALLTLQNHLQEGSAEPRFLGAYGRALRDAGQAQEALLVLQKAEGLTSNAPTNAPLKLGLRQEIAQCYLRLSQPRLALRYLDANDELSQRLRAQASLLSSRMLFSSAAAGTTPSFQQVMFVTQAVLRGGSAVLPAQRAEAKLWQVLALLGNRQIDVAVKLLTETVQQFDVASLEQAMGRGGLPHLQARVLLRFGDFSQGVQMAQKAAPLLAPAEAKTLRDLTMATLNNKAIEFWNKGETERALGLVRLSQAQAPLSQQPPQLSYNHAVMLLARGRHEEAKAVSARLDAGIFPEALVVQGAIAKAQGDAQAALDLYRRYLQLGPGVRTSSDLLGSVRAWADALGRVYDGAAPLADINPPETTAPMAAPPAPTNPVGSAKTIRKPIGKWRRPR